MNKHIYSDQWSETWRKTKESWEKIILLLQRLENGQVGTFLFSLEKFYCTEFKKMTRGENGKPITSCHECPLFQEEYCFNDNITGEDTVFWKFISKLKDNNRDEALKLAEKMLKRIMQDDLSKQKISA